MTLRVSLPPDERILTFPAGEVVRVGRARRSDIRVGADRIDGRFTVSKQHAELRFDGARWSTLNVSDRPGLLWVYEPGYDEVPLEPGRWWIPVRHRWSYQLGHPGHQFPIVATTDDHAGPAAVPARAAHSQSPVADPTAELDLTLVLSLTPLERAVLFAYYSDFARLPRPAMLTPRSHEQAAGRLGRSTDSTRKAIERANEKIGRQPDAPPLAIGRTVAAEVGRWLARRGLLDPGSDEGGRAQSAATGFSQPAPKSGGHGRS